MSVSRRAVLGALGLAAVPALLRSQEVARGITAPRRFAPFNPAAARCSPPGGLTRTLVFAQDNQREFVQSAARGMALAARQRGLAFEVALADNDPRAMVGQVRKALTDRAGALIVAPIDVATLAPVLRLFIAQGMP